VLPEDRASFDNLTSGIDDNASKDDDRLWRWGQSVGRVYDEGVVDVGIFLWAKRRSAENHAVRRLTTHDADPETRDAVRTQDRERLNGLNGRLFTETERRVEDEEWCLVLVAAAGGGTALPLVYGFQGGTVVVEGIGVAFVGILRDRGARFFFDLDDGRLWKDESRKSANEQPIEMS
jgi:hypothetical protein